MKATVRDYRIKTVLNLRGHHPEKSWYRDERDASLGNGATQIDIAMSSCEWMSRKQLQTLIDVIENSEKPLLIHCWRGSERTGLASAFATLLREGSTLEEARDQFSLKYAFVRIGDGVVTIEHFEKYEKWLAENRLTHSPKIFRRWVNEGFVPGSPCREEWAVDPYPLVVYTKTTPKGLDIKKVWDNRGRTPAMNAKAEAEGQGAPLLVR
jgi:hypothetical protein